MGLDPRFVVTSDLESYFVDKDTGEPLAAGIVTFYSDIDRTIKKPVYQITGAPPNYGYSPLVNPCILSGVGTFQDAMGNNIVPYYFPFEGTPDNSSGEIELYYITVYSNLMDGLNTPAVLQFTREGWPNFSDGDSQSTGDVTNLIPNGQFLAHTDIVGTTQPPVTNINGIDVQYIAQGGWAFKRTHGGASTFNNSFTRITTGIAGLNDFPRYAFNFVCSVFNISDLVRDLAIEFPDVNKFSSGNPIGDQDYTFFFAGESLDASTYTFELIVTYNFGSDSATPPAETILGTITITPTESYYSRNITGFPEPVGVLGTLNNDYVSLSLRGPASPWNVQVTDFVLTVGDVTLTMFPEQTNANMLAEGVAGWMNLPNPDGTDLYLTLQLTPKGMQWNHGEVGEIVSLMSSSTFSSSISSITNQLLCDGNSYITANYSPLGIPYSRLFNSVMWNSTYNFPIAGTGTNYASTYVNTSNTAATRIVTNKAGLQTVIGNGAIVTGFTISTLFAGTTSFGVTAFNDLETAGNILVYGNNLGAATVPTAGTSGFTVTLLRYSEVNTRQLFQVAVGALPAAGTYFTFATPVPTNFYVWFTIDGAGADPAPGGTGILVPLLSTYTVAEASYLIRERLCAFQSSSVVVTSAATIPAGSSFVFSANSIKYEPWYKVAGVGTAPTNGIPILITLTGSETAAQVAIKTQIALNSYMYAVPDLRGMILRGWNNSATSFPFDPQSAVRFSFLDTYAGGNIGTYQFDEILSHIHTSNYPVFTTFNVDPAVILGTPVLRANSTTTPSNTSITGGVESRPVNYAVNYAIKY